MRVAGFYRVPCGWIISTLINSACKVLFAKQRAEQLHIIQVPVSASVVDAAANSSSA